MSFFDKKNMIVSFIALLGINSTSFAAEPLTASTLSIEEANLYMQDGFGHNWTMNLGNDGLWFVQQFPTAPYDAPLKIRNEAASNTMVIGSSVIGRESYIGFGTDNPEEVVDVKNDGGAARFQLTSISDLSSDVAQFVQRRARANTTAIQRNDNLGQFSFRGFNGTNWTGTRAGIAVLSAQAWAKDHEGTRLIFTVTQNDTNKPMHGMRIENNGDVYVPNGDLYIGSTQMNVPDYVFDDSYPLLSLERLKEYIKINKHLPGIDSASKIEKNGVMNMGTMQMKLLEKIEELTIYTIQQSETLAQKEAKIAALEQRLNRFEDIEARLKKLESLVEKATTN